MKYTITVELSAYEQSDSNDDLLRSRMSVTAHSREQALAFTKRLDDAMKTIILSASATTPTAPTTPTATKQ